MARGGLGDIVSNRVAVISDPQTPEEEAERDRLLAEGFLVLTTSDVESIGAGSLLIGGVRRQTAEGPLFDVSQGAETVIVDTSAADPALLDALKALRRELAREQNVPAYVIFPDRTLIELAAARPRTLEAMHAVHGIGAAKLERYGAAFLDVVLDHAEAGDGLPDEQGQTTASPP